MYAAARKYLKRMGVLHKAHIYYENSARWLQQIVKYSIENARRSEYVAGYDLLGAVDCHWHRTGYAVGLLNEFYEMKPGVSKEKVLNYNGANVLLADCGKHRNIACNQPVNIKIWASLYGQAPLEQGKVTWVLLDEERHVYVQGEHAVQNIANGKVEALGAIQISVPNLPYPRKMLLEVSLKGTGYHVKNSWDYWVFPEQEKAVTSDRNNQASRVRLLTELDHESIDFVARGGKAILLGSGPFPTLPTTFQIMSGGRVHGNNATVVRDHPFMVTFPHEGFCDWQFYTMLEGAETVVFNDLEIPFHPIVEIVSSYKMIRKQSSLFELQVGAGRLLVCTLKLDETDCGAQYLLHAMLNYMNSEEFAPQTIVSPEWLKTLLLKSSVMDVDFSTDEGYDDGGHVKTQ